MSIPKRYDVSFDSLYQDLQTRALSRLLIQFYDSTILKQVLAALVQEVQELSDAIVDTMKLRTLYYAQGVQLDGIGQIVGQSRWGWHIVSVPIVEEDPNSDPNAPEFVTEDELHTIDAQINQYSALSDQDYSRMLLLKIACNFTHYTSAPEISAAIYQATDTMLKLRRVGPAALNVMVSPQTDPDLIHLMAERMDTAQADQVYFFPYPATCAINVAYNDVIVMEDGKTPIVSQDLTEEFITEDIPFALGRG